MKIADEKTHIALSYIAAATRGGGVLTALALEEFANSPNKARARYESLLAASLAGSIASMADAFGRGELIAEAETWAHYFVRLSWVIVDGDSIRLSSLGKAVLHELERPIVDVDSEEPISVIIDPKDSFAYIRVFELISSHGGGVFVDPYLGTKELLEVLNLSSVNRLLIGDQKKKDHSLMAMALGKAANPPEVRFLSQKLLHDRFFIPDMGDVISFGSSLNTLVKRPGVVVPIKDPAASMAMREVYESFWQKAEKIVPSFVED
ncbi:hypothetical protein [Salinibacterium sp. NYA9b]